MPLESLLMSRDPQVVRVLRLVMDDLDIQMEVCQGARSGTEILLFEKFDAVIVDCDDLRGGRDVLHSLRSSASNGKSVAFAILNGKTTTHEAFEFGANFVLQKPVSRLNAVRCFSAALGLMVRERRRYFRHSVDMRTTLMFGQKDEVPVTMTNISEGGMAIRFQGDLPKAGLSKVIFNVPELGGPMDPKAQLVWFDRKGRAGIRFLDLPITSRKRLEKWLEKEMKAAGEDLEYREHGKK
jgi:DNA-binding NarL/FixJ family response regulator